MGATAFENLASSQLAPGPITTQNLNPSSGVPTPGSSVQFELGGYAGAAFQILGSWTGTITAQYSIDNGANWWTDSYTTALNGTNSSAGINVNTASPFFFITLPGMTHVRLTATAAMTGSATVTITGTMFGGSAPVALAGGGGIAANSTIVGPLGNRSAATSVSTTLNGQGQQTSANSSSVVLASDSAAITVAGAKVAVFTTQQTISVGTTATVLLAANAARVGYALTGNGPTDQFHGNASVADGTTALANGGTRLGGSGGQWILSGYTGAVSGITHAGTENTAVIEW